MATEVARSTSAALSFLRDDPNVAASFKDAARIVDGCTAELKADNDAAAAIAAIPIHTDLARIRVLVAQRKAARHFTVAETRELERVIRDGCELLATNHRERLTYLQLLGLLRELDLDPEGERGRIEIRYLALSEIATLGANLQQHAPRSVNWLLDRMCVDTEAKVIWWDVRGLDQAAA